MGQSSSSSKRRRRRWCPVPRKAYAAAPELPEWDSEGVSLTGCSVTEIGILTAGLDGTVSLYNGTRQIFGTHDAPANGIVRSTTFAVSYSRDRTLIQWHLRDGRKLQTFRGHDLNVSTAAVAPDESFVVSGSRDYTVRLWDVEKGVELRRQKVPRNIVTCLRWIPNTVTFLQGSEDLHLRIWDTRLDKPALTFPPTPYFSLCLDCQGHHIVAGTKGFSKGQGCNVLLYDVRAPDHPTHSDDHHSQDVTGVHFLSESSSKLLSCSKDGSIRLWNPDDHGLAESIPQPHLCPHLQPIFTGLDVLHPSSVNPPDRRDGRPPFLAASTTFQGGLYAYTRNDHDDLALAAVLPPDSR